MEQFNRDGSIPDDMLPEMEKSLLDALNNQDLSLGNSSIYPFRILPDIKELIVWIGVNFSIYPKVEAPDSLFADHFSKQIRLISFNDFKRYDLVWEYDIENFTKHHKDFINISIIEDYKKILPLITNFKKELRQKTGHLPYLGERNVNGNCFLLDKKIYRPDYDRIKANKTISLKNCICILLGIDDFSLISKIDGDLEFIAEEQKRYSWKDDFAMPEIEADETLPENYATMKYREGWNDIISFVEDFISKINSELEEGNIKRVGHNALSEHNNNLRLYDINQETHKCDFETLPFLKWVKESGYEIPDELDINESPDGTLEWANPDKTNGLSPYEMENSVLSGKERQELGRLKVEKNTMDLTVAAAIDVGKFIENEKNEGRRIVKKNISDLINKFDSKIPNTRIDLIWKSISDDYKSGPGRPKKE